jgi:hypothetical protein
MSRADGDLVPLESVVAGQFALAVGSAAAGLTEHLEVVQDIGRRVDAAADVERLPSELTPG